MIVGYGTGHSTGRSDNGGTPTDVGKMGCEKAYGKFYIAVGVDI